MESFIKITQAMIFIFLKLLSKTIEGIVHWRSNLNWLYGMASEMEGLGPMDLSFMFQGNLSSLKDSKQTP